MNLRQLKYFVRVVEAGNMTRAAEHLHLAQTALGMQIRQLEEELGVALLVRHSRGIDPTPAGTLLLARAQEILRMVDETRREVSACDRENSESIRLGMTPSLMHLVAPDIAVKVREQIPQLFLSLVEEMSHVLVNVLLRDEIDLILAYDVPDVIQLSRTAVYQEDLVLVVLPGPAGGQAVSFAEAMDETLVLPEHGDSVREHVVRTARELGMEPRIAFEVRSIPAIKNLVLRGAASAILPCGSVIDELRRGALDVRPIISPSLRRTLFLASSSKRTPFRHELALTGIVRSSLGAMIDVVGPLAHPLPPQEV